MYSSLRMLGLSSPDLADAVLYAQIVKASEKLDTAAAKLCMEYSDSGPFAIGEGDSQILREQLDALSFDELLAISGGLKC